MCDHHPVAGLTPGVLKYPDQREGVKMTQKGNAAKSGNHIEACWALQI